MKKVQMFGAEKIEVNYDGVMTDIVITNNKSKLTACFNFDNSGVICQTGRDYKPSGKSIARALSISDSLREKVLA